METEVVSEAVRPAGTLGDQFFCLSAVGGEWSDRFGVASRGFPTVISPIPDRRLIV